LPRKNNHWTNKEIVLLEKLFASASWRELSTALPRHSRGSISATARAQGLRKEMGAQRWLKICAAYVPGVLGVRGSG